MHILKESFLGVCLVLIAMANAEDVSQALSSISQEINKFSSRLYQSVAEENPGNLIMSPLNAAFGLAMAAYGAGGKTKDEFKDVLYLPAPDSLGTSGYQALIDDLSSTLNNTLYQSNKVFVAKKFYIKPTYQKFIESYFRSIIQLINFEDPDEAAATINAWVDQSTKGSIRNLLSPDDLNERTSMVLANVVYFKGQWKLQFDNDETKFIKFHNNASTQQVVLAMSVTSRFKYGELPDLQATFVELPYEEDELSMVIILPNEINDLTVVERKLKNTDIKDILNQGYIQNVQLYLPKFKVESNIDLNKPLRNLGLTDMFSHNANFSGIATEPLAVSKVVHKALIEIDEKGSEAAAASETLMILPISSAGSAPLKMMRIDRPWSYFICKKIKNPYGGKDDVLILFRGRVTKIEQ